MQLYRAAEDSSSIQLAWFVSSPLLMPPEKILKYQTCRHGVPWAVHTQAPSGLLARVSAQGYKTPGQNGFVLSEPHVSWTLLLWEGSKAALRSHILGGEAGRELGSCYFAVPLS